MKAYVDQQVDVEWIEDFIIQRHLDYGEKALFERAIEIREYQQGEVIIEQGEVAQGLFFLKKGMVSMHVKGLNDSVCVGRMEEGAQLGDMAILTVCALAQRFTPMKAAKSIFCLAIQ